MFIVMFSSPSKYLVFRKKNKLTASVQSGFYEAVSTGIASAGPGNRAIGQTLYILVRVQVNRVKINQNFMKWNLTPLIKCIWYNIYLSTHLNSSIIKKNGRLSAPPKKITSGHIFWNQMSRTMLGWRLDELFVHPSIITSPSAPPRQPPMSAAPFRVYPRDKCKDCECKGCVNQVVFSVWTYHPPTLKLKLVELENLNHSTYASCFTMETNGRHFVFSTKFTGQKMWENVGGGCFFMFTGCPWRSGRRRSTYGTTLGANSCEGKPAAGVNKNPLAFRWVLPCEIQPRIINVSRIWAWNKAEPWKMMFSISEW